jgi:hypothetical protein
MRTMRALLLTALALAAGCRNSGLQLRTHELHNKAQENGHTVLVRGLGGCKGPYTMALCTWDKTHEGVVVWFNHTSGPVPVPGRRWEIDVVPEDDVYKLIRFRKELREDGDR